MLARVLFLFVVVPLVELVLLIQLGRVVGLWPTIGLVVLTGILGGMLARAQGLRTLARIQGELASGRVPGQALLDGAAILAGGALLLTPGILTDALGFALLIPVTRRGIQGMVQRRLVRSVAEGRLHVTFGGFPPGGPAAGPPGGPTDPDPDGRASEGPAEDQPYRPGRSERDSTN